MKKKIYAAMLDWFSEDEGHCACISPRKVVLDGTYDFEALSAHIEKVITEDEDDLTEGQSEAFGI